MKNLSNKRLTVKFLDANNACESGRLYAKENKLMGKSMFTVLSYMVNKRKDKIAFNFIYCEETSYIIWLMKIVCPYIFEKHYRVPGYNITESFDNVMEKLNEVRHASKLQKKIN